MVKIVVAGRRHLDLKTRGKYHAPFTPDIGMQQKGHATLTKAPEYAFKSAMMVSMSMRKDHRTQIVRPQRKPEVATPAQATSHSRSREVEPVAT